MDPVTAIGLVSGIITIVESSTKILSSAKEVYDFGHGSTAENRSLASITKEMQDLSSRLILPESTDNHASPFEGAISVLAAECKAIADDIIALLAKMSASDSVKSWRQSLWAAARGVWYQKDKEELLKRLDRCRAQLTLHVDDLNRSEAKDQLGRLLHGSQQQSVNLQQLQIEVVKTRNAIISSPNTTVYQERLLKFFDSLMAAGSQAAEQLFLRALVFEGMHSRVGSIVGAHRETFKWIFDNPVICDDDDPLIENVKQCPPGHRFTEWLSSGSGIFHIAGKLGSGKSTLMKLVCSHPRTIDRLQEWAGEKKLVVASYFFWNPGLPLQKSIPGLVRTLLHDILQECPALIPLAFPDKWRTFKQSSYLAQVTIPLRAEDIERGFLRLLDAPLGHCFCFFIDGLDEIDESLQSSQRGLVRTLRDWTQSHPGSVKICVSSREYNVFAHFASEEQTLRLQDLTKKDIRLYVQRQLQTFSHADGHDALVTAIANRASGVFLWVSIVTNTILDLLEDGFTISTVTRELNTLPSAVEDLFRRVLLANRPRAMRRVAFRTFAMIRARIRVVQTEPHAQLPTMDMYYFMEDYEADAEFATKNLALKAELPCSETAAQEIARRRLRGCCSGLVEVNNDGGLCFTHRSVPELLQSPDIQSEMDQYLQGFSPIEGISQLGLAALRHFPWMADRNTGALYTAFKIICVRATAKVEHAPFPFLETLAAIMLEKGMKVWPCPGTNQIWAPSTWNHFRHYSTAVGPEQKPVRVFEVASPMLLSALEGGGDYVCWKVQQDRALTRTPLKCGLLMGLIGFGARPGSLRVSLVLLENGLAPDTVIHFGYGSLFGNVGRKLTFWQGLIYYIARAADNITDSESRELLGGVVQAFLENGADPALHISTRSQVKRMGWGIEPVMRSPELDVSVSFDGTLAVIPSIGYSLHESIVSRGGVITLSDLIDFWKPKNGNAILKLIQQSRPGSCSVKHVSDELLESEIVADRKMGTADKSQRSPGRGADAASDTLRSWPPIVIPGLGRDIGIVLLVSILLASTAMWLRGIE